jgi:hypothetical protein
MESVRRNGLLAISGTIASGRVRSTTHLQAMPVAIVAVSRNVSPDAAVCSRREENSRIASSRYFNGRTFGCCTMTRLLSAGSPRVICMGSGRFRETCDRPPAAGGATCLNMPGQAGGGVQICRQAVNPLLFNATAAFEI